MDAAVDDEQVSVTVVVRSAGERTTDICLALVRSQLPNATVSLLELNPFEAALRRCYELGIESRAKWMLTVDADVLLRPGSGAEMLAAAESMPQYFFQLEGRVYDKVTGMYRRAGHRIYRTAMLERALAEIPAFGTQLRPESYTIRNMGEAGFPSRRCAFVVGVHDFEQYYRDLYRKGLLHAAKHGQLIGEMIARCTEKRQDDPDYQVILKGLCDGLMASERVTVDSRRYEERAIAALELLGLAEKSPLQDNASKKARLMELTEAWAGEDRSAEFAPSDVSGYSTNSGWINQIRHRIRRKGAVGGSLAVVGAAMKRAGIYLDD